jgi:phosphoglycolate phosphatase-like HAD superfamily hydrolase
MIELVVLDMAGTTIEDHGAVYDALRGAVEKTGAPVAQADLQTWMGTEKHEAIAALIRLGGGTPTPALVEEAYADFAAMLAEAYRATPPLALPGVAR